MSSDINHVILIGRLIRDPELRYTPSGKAVASFSIANNQSIKSGGEWKKQVSYFDCVAWSKLAETITQYCKKGHRIAIEGKLQQRRWEDADKNKHSRVEIIVSNIQFLTAKEAQESNTADSIQDIFDGVPSDNPFDDDDIPF